MLSTNEDIQNIKGRLRECEISIKRTEEEITENANKLRANGSTLDEIINSPKEIELNETLAKQKQRKQDTQQKLHAAKRQLQAEQKEQYKAKQQSERKRRVQPPKSKEELQWEVETACQKFMDHMLDVNPEEGSRLLTLSPEELEQVVKDSGLGLKWATYTAPSEVATLTDDQKAAVEEFIEVLSLSDREIPKAVHTLQNCNWDVNSAIASEL